MTWKEKGNMLHHGSKEAICGFPYRVPVRDARVWEIATHAAFSVKLMTEDGDIIYQGLDRNIPYSCKMLLVNMIIIEDYDKQTYIVKRANE